MDIWKVIVRDTISIDLGKRLKQNLDKVVAAIVTQMFYYMIQYGLKYSYITTKEAFIFL